MVEDGRRGRLARLEEEKTVLRKRMASRAEEWKQAAAEWAKDDWERTVERAIQQRPAEVKELAANGQLSVLKQQLGQLRAGASEKVAEQFDDARLWSHVDGTVFVTDGYPSRADEHRYETYQVNSGPRVFDDHLRRLKGEALGLLDEVGLLDADERTAARRSGDGYRYPYGFDWPQELIDRMSVYSEDYKAFAKLDVEREKIEAELAREEADRLWRQA